MGLEIGLTGGRAFAYTEKSEVMMARMANGEAHYEYDGIGNRISAGVADARVNYWANELNQYTRVVATAQQETLSYDWDGNVIQRGVWSFKWDGENRLQAVYSNGCLVVSNRYDNLARRIWKQTATATTEFVYDGWNVVLEQTRARLPGNRLSGSCQVQVYSWGLDVSGSPQGAGGVGGLLAVGTANGMYYPVADANGNITAYVNEQGECVANYAFDAFGQTIAKNGALANAFSYRFSSKPLDLESGCYYYGYRYYSPADGRWLGRDPLEEDGGINLYAACGNNLINDVDVLGEQRYSGSFSVKGTGHHIIPVELWKEFGFEDEFKQVFDDNTVPAPDHDRNAHVSTAGYTAHVRDEINKILKEKGLTAKQIRASEAPKLAAEIVQRVKTSSNPFIRDFLLYVGNRDEFKKWAITISKTLPKPTGDKAIKMLRYARPVAKGGLIALKCGRKVPIVKYVTLVGCLYLWEDDYDNARADGYSTMAAGAIASARAADPGFEMAWDFGWSIGCRINDVIGNY